MGAISLLQAKIHRATVTHADLEYEGSVTIPPSLLAATGMLPNQEVSIWNVTRGTRLSTYIIAGDREGLLAINGAAAHLMSPGDKVIIASFITLAEEEAKSHEPTVVFVDDNNIVKEMRAEKLAIGE
jgi:aspartate 1-decarboxylase